MKALSPLALSRPVRVDPMPQGGMAYVVEADASERAKLAKLNGLVELESLKATFELTPAPGRKVKAVGRLAAKLTQNCVVTLEPLTSLIDEAIELEFAPEGPATANPDDEDAPDPIVDGTINLGAVTAEFLTLNVDPYPRKSGVEFEAPTDEETASPFAALAKGKERR